MPGEFDDKRRTLIGFLHEASDFLVTKKLRQLWWQSRRLQWFTRWSISSVLLSSHISLYRSDSSHILLLLSQAEGNEDKLIKAWLHRCRFLKISHVTAKFSEMSKAYSGIGMVSP